MKTSNFFILFCGLLSFSCEKEVICDQSVAEFYTYTPDSLEYLHVVDITQHDTLYSYYDITGSFKYIDDSHFMSVGPNNTLGINYIYRFQGDTVGNRVVGFCISTDNCHVIGNSSIDTLKWN